MSKKILLSCIVLVLILGGVGVFFLLPRGTKLDVNGTRVTVTGGQVNIVPTSQEKTSKLASISKLSSSLGSTVDVTRPDGTGGPLEKPFTIAFKLKPNTVVRNPYIARFDDARNVWVRLPSSYNEQTHTLSAQLDHLTTIDARTESAAREFAEAKLQEMVDEVEESGKGYSDGLDGGYVIVDGEVNLSANGGDFATAFEIPTENRNTWGCNPDPGDGDQRKKLERPFDTTQVAEATQSIQAQTGGDALQVLLRVLGVWNFDFGRDTTLQGQVTDQNHKAVKKAEIKLRNLKTGKTFSEKTDDSGHYDTKLPSGIYSVTASKKQCDTKKVNQAVCGWGPVLTDSLRTDTFTLDIPTSCTYHAEGGYTGTVDVTIVSRPPGAPAASFNQKHDVDLTLTQTKPKKDGLFWEGEWEGTFLLTVHQNLGDFAGLLKGIGQVTRDDVNTQETAIKMHLVANKNGQGLSSESYFETEVKTDVNVNAAGTVLGESFSKSTSVSGAGTKGRGQIILVNQNENELVIKFKQSPPFDDAPPMPYIDYIIKEKPSITLHKVEEE